MPTRRTKVRSQTAPPAKTEPAASAFLPSPIRETVTPIDPPAAQQAPADFTEPPKPPAVQADNGSVMRRLPPSGLLTYQFYWGESRWLAGQAVHQWTVDNGFYTLSSKVSTTGLFGLLSPLVLVESSRGTIRGDRLRPLQFSTQLNDRPPAVAIFNWEKHHFRWLRDRASFTQTLPANSFDKISFLYQLYIAAQIENFYSADITLGRRLEHYDIRNLGVEEVEIDGSSHPAIHLKRATSSADMEQVDIWLSTTGNLPLRMIYSNNAGEYFEQLITADSLPAR